VFILHSYKYLLKNHRALFLFKKEKVLHPKEETPTVSPSILFP